jgi:hypothetical protein
VERLIQLAGQSGGLGLQVAIRYHPIHQIEAIGSPLLKAEVVEQLGPPQLSQGIGHLAEHQPIG